MAMKPLGESSPGLCQYLKTANIFAVVSSTTIDSSSPQPLVFLGIILKYFKNSEILTNMHYLFSSKAYPSLRVKIGALVLGIPEPDEQNIEILSIDIYPSYDDVFKQNDLALVNVRFFLFINQNLIHFRTSCELK
jgi:hypothetical protein